MLRLFTPAAILVALSITFTTPTLAEEVSHATETPHFVDYPGIEEYQGPLAPPALAKDMCEEVPEDEMCFWNYRTRIGEGTEGVDIDFNGAFTIVWWGCGTECKRGAVVDRTDGKIYPLPEAALGYEYIAESALLVVNPTPSDYWDGTVPDWLWREFYVFKNGHFVLVYQDKGSPLDVAHPVDFETFTDQELDRQACLEDPAGEFCPTS